MNFIHSIGIKYLNSTFVHIQWRAIRLTLLHFVRCYFLESVLISEYLCIVFEVECCFCLDYNRNLSLSNSTGNDIALTQIRALQFVCQTNYLFIFSEHSVSMSQIFVFFMNLLVRQEFEWRWPPNRCQIVDMLMLI